MSLAIDVEHVVSVLLGASSKVARCESDRGHGGEHHWHGDKQWVRWSGT